ncbi:hypothetical protein [Streptomyces sp. NPDC057257]|uniref:hypothetical protein n=1 Tax=Streptomyces sp. NPDC057257 TaxID=3346071 RepID=UPI0036373870
MPTLSLPRLDTRRARFFRDSHFPVRLSLDGPRAMHATHRIAKGAGFSAYFHHVAPHGLDGRPAPRATDTGARAATRTG